MRFGHNIVKGGLNASGSPVPFSIEDNGGLAVNIQDQHTAPVNSYFAKSISNFTISEDTVASTSTSLVYTFEATAGHGISATNEVLLLDTASNREILATVTNVSTNTITIDRPIDHAFAAATTLGRIVTTDMNVDGSVTPQIFSIRAGSVAFDMVSTMLTMTDNAAMDYSTFGGLSALTNGLVFRIINSYQKTIFCFKTNGEIAQFSFDNEYAAKAPSGEYGYSAEFKFGGQGNRGVVLRIQDTDVIQWVVQDDLSGLLSLKASAMGHYIET